VMDEVVGPGPVVLAGHSMGGMTIMHLARTRPELFGTRVLGVALFATAAGEMAEHSPIRGLPGRAFSRLVPPLMATLNRIPELVQKTRTAGSDLSFVLTKRGAFGSDVPVSYVDFMSEMLGRTPLEVVADFYPAFTDLDEYEAFGVLNKVETAVIGGEDDSFTPVHHTDRIIDALPKADVRRLANCGHMGIIEHAGAFNEVLEALLTRARRRLPLKP
jgi:pimeloyl-ACP methyl ester carboxylesterase